MIEAVASNNGVVVLSPPAGTEMEARVGTVITAMGPKKSVLVCFPAHCVSPISRTRACLASLGVMDGTTCSDSCCYLVQPGVAQPSSFGL